MATGPLLLQRSRPRSSCSREVPLLSQSVTTTLTRTIIVAGGIFAPGHLGELTQYLPFKLIDDVLAWARPVQRCTWLLPSRVGVYFVLALDIPGPGLPTGLGQADRRSGIAASAPALGEGAAGPAPRSGSSTVEDAVRGGGRPAGAADQPRASAIGVGAPWLSTAAARCRLPTSRGSACGCASSPDSGVASRATRICGS